jgi:hypothetical protein
MFMLSDEVDPVILAELLAFLFEPDAPEPLCPPTPLPDDFDLLGIGLSSRSLSKSSLFLY